MQLILQSRTGKLSISCGQALTIATSAFEYRPMAINPNTSLPFLCVCGRTIQVDARKGGHCDECGREHSGHAVNVSMSMTIGLPSAAESESVEDDEMLGQSLDHFRIIDRLGGGGMGTVYRAMDESLQRYVAIKIIRRSKRRPDETDHVERLLQEARAQARVNHANVVHIYFVSRDKQRPYLAMELVPGPTLAERVTDGPLPYVEVVRTGLQIAEALRESAQFDIVHGDIKPSNILLHEDIAKLSDFGLSQRISQSDPTTAKVVGTPNYMAPEVCRGEPATAQSDMYSFGVMMFEMSFGRLPYTFSDSTVESRLDAHQNTVPEFPAIWPPAIPESWQPFLEHLLAKDPVDRFKSGDALITEMRSLRPLRLVAAGRLKRGIAWGLDLLVLSFAQALVVAPLAFTGRTFFPDSLVFKLLSMAGLLIVPVLVMWWVSKGGSSPGKKLMQLRVVDRHGLRLRPRILARRSILQYLPIWCGPITNSETLGTTGYISTPISVAVGLFLLLEILLAIFRREGRSLHDQIFGTRVVLFDSRDSQ